MPKPVYLMTVHEAHKEYNSLIDQIQAKYELLDSGECGSVGTPAFNAECSELAHLMARMSELCKHLNLPMPKELHRPPHFKHWSRLNSKLFLAGSVRVWRMQLCHSFVRITGLLSAPITFKNWGLAVHLACNHPWSLTSPRIFKYKAASLELHGGEPLNPQDGRYGYNEPSLLAGWGATVYRVSLTSLTWYLYSAYSVA